MLIALLIYPNDILGKSPAKENFNEAFSFHNTFERT